MFPAAVVLVITVGTTALIVATGEGDPAPAAGPQPLVPTGTASASAVDLSAVAASAVPPPTTTPAARTSTTTAGGGGGAAPARFTTLGPGSALPSGAQCATWVRAQPYPENKGVNRTANQTTGHHIGSDFFGGDDPRANGVIGPRVDGQFTGTTGQILRWAACKWGIDEDMVFAQAAIESWWRQDTMGDWSSDASRCAPGRDLGVDGKPGQCPESFGILQNRYPYEKSAWPGIASSTAMNADLAYAIWRVCFEGYEGWLNTVERGRDYAAGDAWGCFGRWFSGRWHTDAAEGYIGRVRDYLNQRIWTTPNFQQP
jgi:autotransporter family porin